MGSKSIEIDRSHSRGRWGGGGGGGGDLECSALNVCGFGCVLNV